MAEEGEKGDPLAIAGALFGFIFVVSIGWFMVGGWQRADLGGYFLSPPSSPQIIIPSDGNAIIQGPTTTAPTHPNATSAPQL